MPKNINTAINKNNIHIHIDKPKTKRKYKRKNNKKKGVDFPLTSFYIWSF